jgi:hypothetical protein
MTSHESTELKQLIAATAAENMALKERVEVLEKKSRTGRYSLFILSLLFLFAVYMDTFFHTTFSGRWIAVHDREQHLRAWFDDEGLQLKDANGKERAKLGLSSNGAPYLHFFDEQHHIRAQLYVDQDHGGLQFFDEKPEVRAQLFMYPENGGTSGYLMLHDKQGKGVRYPPPEKPLP